MKYRYIITSTFHGAIFGTNDEAKAKEIAYSEDDFVYDTETGLWIMPEGITQELLEYGKSYPIPAFPDFSEEEGEEK